MEWNVKQSRINCETETEIKLQYMKYAVAYPLNMALAERWKRTSVEVIPTHTPFIARVAGSDTQCTCGLPWGDAERGKERRKKRGDKATNIRLELESSSCLSPA